MSKPVIISGEASETDSEDESNTRSPKNIMIQSVQGAMITGEDSESEYENDASIASAVSALNQSNFENKNHEDSKYDSLFHQKLKEYNARLYNNLVHNNLDGLTQTSVNGAGRKLNTIDQQLLRSQLTLQSAVTSLKSLSVNSLTVKSKLHSLLSAKFLPNVKVNK